MLGEKFVLSGCCCHFDTLCYAMYNDLLVPLVMCYNIGEFTRVTYVVMLCIFIIMFHLRICVFVAELILYLVC